MFGFLPRLIDRAGQVAAANAEFNGDEAFLLLPVNHRGARPLELAAQVNGTVFTHRTDQIAQPQSRRVAQGIGGARQTAADRGRGLTGPAGRRDKPRPLGLNHLVVADVYGNVEDRSFIASPPCRPTNRHVEDLLAFDHLGHGLAP